MFKQFMCLGSRRPSILPVAETMTGSSLNISVPHQEEDGDESEDELEDEVPWRSPSEKIA